MINSSVRGELVEPRTVNYSGSHALRGNQVKSTAVFDNTGTTKVEPTIICLN